MWKSGEIAHLIWHYSEMPRHSRLGRHAVLATRSRLIDSSVDTTGCDRWLELNAHRVRQAHFLSGHAPKRWARKILGISQRAV